ncbi:nuclear envelope protein [Niveomyces insectorum RCEF 264]|uniref:Nuclear envelope protein n=1 Tax=Niveomyces insectorum RCEF 264 TaxID=1081102 RepID=A0A167QAB1_9HYPO|nr:nuclear envelope protein [Niveomyces insectorum RCEF 264]
MSTTVARSLPLTPSPVRRALPYKDFLQPALHRRFSSTALVLLATAYVQSLFLSSWSSWLWVWFPLSGAGFRAAVIFFCGLVVIVLRIAQFHIGIRTSNSPFETFLYNVAKPATAETVLSYCLAAWLYAQVYRWSMPASVNLGWITHHPGDRTRLNERALFLVVHVVFVGAVNALLRLFLDSDRLLLGVTRPLGTRPSASSSSPTPTPTPPAAGRTTQLYKTLLRQLPFLLATGLALSLVSVVVSVPVYFFFLRPMAWRVTLSFFRPFYNLPKSSLPPMANPYVSTPGFIPRCIAAGALFSVLLLVSNAAFSIFLVNEPLKDGQPLTSESRDPNGSLLNGLKSKKDKIKAFSLWELAFIARDVPDRRVAIYTDIERKDGSTWSQICRFCLDVVTTLETRIDGPPPAAADAATATAATAATAGNAQDATKKPPGGNADEVKRLTKPLREDPVLVATPQKRDFQSEVEKMVNKVAVNPQKSPRLSPMTKKALVDAKKRLLDVQRGIRGPEDTNSGLQNAVRRVLAVPVLGWPFRRTFRNRITAVVLGGPYGEPSIYVNAVNALALLAVHSLQEDTYGHVQRDVATIIRTFTRVAQKLETLTATFPVHWTDVYAERTCPEVDSILDALQDALAMLLSEFGQYSRDLKLTQADMRLAEEAATAGRRQKQTDYGPEMREVQ